MLFDADLSLRWKIPLRVMLAVLGTAFAVTSALLVWEYDEMRQNLQGHAKNLGRVLSNTLAAPILHDDIWRAYEILQSAHVSFPEAPELQAEVIVITDSQNHIFVSTQPKTYPVGLNLTGHNTELARAASKLSANGLSSQSVIDPASSNSLYFIVTPMLADGIALGHVIQGYTTATFFPRFVRLVGRAALVTLFVLLIILPVSWFYAARTGEPLMQLAEAMRKIPQSVSAPELDRLPESRDEIGQLGTAFRRMVHELQDKEALERQMLVSERLAAVGRLTAGIAHEINNPLAGMLTSIDTFRKHAPDQDKMTLSTLALLERGLLQIKQTVAALLVETKAKDRAFTPDDIDDVLILVDAQARTRQLTLQVHGELHGALPLPSTLIRQILLNLLLNAVNAAPVGGQVDLDISASADELMFRIANDGEHIPQEQLDTLFEPFVTSRDQGHGLGLWIVYQIIQQLGGQIIVESEPGQTTFTAIIPHEHDI
jgi:two-component system, NtrC family, sensor kinase